ncbi:unnamed protein product, partial [Brugia timori]|uniref:Queuosine 5'-phosphate N-glycosylase/hydrolase n=1 Tax=Brugia timori TaxID=42155 RepID=A0A0R3R673_9BILA
MSFFTNRLYPRGSAEFIVANDTTNIKLCQDGILKVAELIMSNDFTEDTFFSLDVHPQMANRRTRIFLVDTINFSFWSDDVNFKVTFHDKQHTGYFAACACINRALEGSIPITNPDYMENITEDDDHQNCTGLLCNNYTGREIPLLKERVEEFDGTFYNCVLKCNRSAIKLMECVVEYFGSYRDFATYKGQKISFLKRAQILVSDIYSCMRKIDDACYFHDINELTMFADYRVPQVLHFLGVLKYSPALMKKLNEKELLQNGSEYEVELRGFSIKAC